MKFIEEPRPAKPKPLANSKVGNFRNRKTEAKNHFSINYGFSSFPLKTWMDRSISESGRVPALKLSSQGNNASGSVTTATGQSDRKLTRSTALPAYHFPFFFFVWEPIAIRSTSFGKIDACKDTFEF
jgi:hypothetical protein